MPGYPIRFQKQLGRGIPVPGGTRGSRDCGPRSVQMLIDGQTNKVVDIPTLRRKMGKSGPQTTNVADAKRGVENISVRGHKPMTYTIRTLASELRAAVRAGRGVHVCIDYGKWNDVMGQTGDPGFRDGHSIAVRGQRTFHGKVQWRVYDPLDDNRRPEITGPGPRWVDREDVVRAAEAFARARGRCWVGVIGGGQARKR